MKKLQIVAFIAGLFVSFGVISVNPRPAKAETTDEPIRQTVVAFWKAFGELDGDKMKATLDWPNVIIETKPGNTVPGKIHKTIAEFDAEIKRATAGRNNTKARSDFYGTEVTKIDVQLINDTLAIAYHVCRLGDKTEGQVGHEFDAVAVLRKSAEGGGNGKWRIILISVPK